MNWDAIGAIAELAGAAAVFISLVYLASQIRNSKRSDQVIAASQAASASLEWIGQLVGDGELNELFMRGSADFESLNREEKYRFSWLIMQFLRSVEGVWLLYKADAIDAESWTSYEQTISAVASSEGAIYCYKRNRSVLDCRFANEVDKILVVS